MPVDIGMRLDALYPSVKGSLQEREKAAAPSKALSERPPCLLRVIGDGWDLRPNSNE
jgi:hypothetical protein